MRIVLQKFFVMIRLDHERVDLAQPLDHHLRRVTKIGDEPERARAGMKRVADADRPHHAGQEKFEP